MCRTDDYVMQTQGQGLTSRSCDLPMNFVSAPYLLNSLKDNDFTSLKYPSLSEMISKIHDSAMQTKGQGHVIYP